MSAKRIIRRNWWRTSGKPGETFHEFLLRMGLRKWGRLKGSYLMGT